MSKATRFKAGHEKKGGRTAGTPNKKKIPRVADYLAERDFNPIKEIIDALEDPKSKLSPYTRIQTCMDLLAYCQAKPRDDGPDDPSDAEPTALDKLENVTDETLLRLVKNEAE